MSEIRRIGKPRGTHQVSTVGLTFKLINPISKKELGGVNSQSL